MKTLAAIALTACLALIGCAESAAPDAGITAATHRVEASVQGMTCSGCTGEVCNAVEQVAGVTGATADLETGKVTVALADDADTDAAKAEIEKIIAGLSDGKYTVGDVQAFTPDADTPAENETDPDPADASSEDA